MPSTTTEPIMQEKKSLEIVGEKIQSLDSSNKETKDTVSSELVQELVDSLLCDSLKDLQLSQVEQGEGDELVSPSSDGYSSVTGDILEASEEIASHIRLDSQGSQQEPHATEVTLIESLPPTVDVPSVNEVENENVPSVNEEKKNQVNVNVNKKEGKSNVEATSPRNVSLEPRGNGMVVRSTNPILNALNESIQRIKENDPTFLIFNLQDCPLFSIQHGSLVAEALKANTYLQELNLQNTQLQTCTAMELAEALKLPSVNLKRLNLQGNAIQPSGMRALADMIKVNTSLNEIRLGNQKYATGTDAEQELENALQVNTSLQKFVLLVRNVSCRNSIDRAITRNKEMQRMSRLK